jgi:phenylpyruvate tautomerase PptA (4-oxalocrotonate tautomerase family)
VVRPLSKDPSSMIEEIIVGPRHGDGHDGAARGQLRMVEELTPQSEELFDDCLRRTPPPRLHHCQGPRTDKVEGSVDKFGLPAWEVVVDRPPRGIGHGQHLGKRGALDPLGGQEPGGPFHHFRPNVALCHVLGPDHAPPLVSAGAMQVIIVSVTMSACIQRKVPHMPMIDVYATDGTFEQGGQLAADLARTLMAIEGVPDIPMFRLNTAAFIHEMPAGSISNVEGQDTYVRVQVLTNAGALDRDKQLAVVSQFTQLVSQAANDPSLAERTWVLLTEAIEGGWGLAGHANTNAELVDAARAQIAEITAAKDGGQK